MASVVTVAALQHLMEDAEKERGMENRVDLVLDIAAGVAVKVLRKKSEVGPDLGILEDHVVEGVDIVDIGTVVDTDVVIVGAVDEDPNPKEDKEELMLHTWESMRREKGWRCLLGNPERTNLAC